MSYLEKIRNACVKMQPYYDELISNYSKSYLSGSLFYIGDNLLEWWDKSNNIRYFTENRNKFIYILYILKIYNQNKIIDQV